MSEPTLKCLGTRTFSEVEKGQFITFMGLPTPLEVVSTNGWAGGRTSIQCHGNHNVTAPNETPVEVFEVDPETALRKAIIRGMGRNWVSIREADELASHLRAGGFLK